MINFDYTIEREVGNNKKHIFKPNKIPTELPNLVYIEGPNSSGKSTLLHILALSMYGYKNNKINPALHNKMNALLDSQHQKLVFNIKITNKDESLKIVSRKNDSDNTEIILFESRNGEPEKPLSCESFENKYNLVYDIPDKPTERLNQLTEEIKDGQQRFGNKVADLNNYIRTIITDISQSRDSKRLEDLKSKLAGITNEKNGLNEEQIRSQNILDLIERYMYCKYFEEYLNKFQYLDDWIKQLEKKSESRTQVKRRFTTQYNNSKNELIKMINEMDGQFRTITSLLNILLSKKEQNHLKIWSRIKLYDSIVDYEFDENLQKEIDHFSEGLNDLKTLEETNESLKEAKIFSDLIDFLKEYENSKIILPGMEMTISDFIHALEEKNKVNQELINRLNNINYSIELLKQLNEKRQNIERELPKLKKLAIKEADHSDTKASVDEIENKLSTYKNDLKNIEKKLDFYYNGCIAKNIDVKSLDDEQLKAKINEIERNKELAPYFRYNDEQLKEQIAQLKDKLQKINEDIKIKNEFIRDYERDIKQQEQKQPHKYQAYKDELNQLFKKTEYIREKLLNEYKENISALIKRDSNISRLKDGNNKKYFLEVSKYLAKRIGIFRHIDKEYKATSIDLICGEIITEENQVIRLIDMGTGQSQSAYLLGLLNTRDDNRQIIALFDEVAMMDSISLEPIYQKFKELYENNRLLVGIVVQKADEVKVVSKI